MAKKKINIDTNTILDHLIDSFTPGELIEFIKEIDKEIADYDFTSELYEYFRGETEEEDLEYQEEEIF